MTEELAKSKSPLENEIEDKRIELSYLEASLAEAELARATLENELRFFERAYNTRVAPFFAELDELRAQIAEAVALLSPHDTDKRDNAAHAREQARTSFREAHEKADDRDAAKKADKFAPSEDIRQLYRELAKKIHPDLADTDEERELRSRLMADINDAYRDGNIQRLAQIAEEWENNRQNPPMNPLEAELQRLKLKIQQIKNRIWEIEKQTWGLAESRIGQLKAKADIAQREGRDLFSEITVELQTEIDNKRDLIRRALLILAEAG